MYQIISLFSGCGGMDLGFIGDFESLGQKYSKNNFDIIFANEINEDACKTYNANFSHKIINKDIRLILENKEYPTKTDIVLGGFPCQDFSLAGKRQGFNNTNRGLLYQAVVETVKRTNPLIFVCENVPGLLTINKGKSIEQIKKEFTDLGYSVTVDLYNLSDFGLPQTRKRVIIIGTRKDRLPQFPKINPSKVFCTTKQAIEDLENLKENKSFNHCWSKAKRTPNTQGNINIESNSLAPTIRSEHHGNIEFHYNGTRRLSVRECARLQSFPDNFIFQASTSANYKQVGNAVPPIFVWHLASNIEKFLSENS